MISNTFRRDIFASFLTLIASPLFSSNENLFLRVKNSYREYPAEALTILDDILNQESLNERDRAKAYYYYGLTFSKALNKKDDAIISFYRALTIYSKNEDSKGQRAVLKNLALTHRELFKYDLAIEYLRKVSKLPCDDSLQFFYTQYNIGKTYRLAGKYDSAILIQQYILPHFEKFQKVVDIIDTRLELGLSFLELKEYDHAINHYNLVLTLADRLTAGERHSAKAINSLGYIALERGELGKSKELLNQSLALFEEVGDHASTILTLNNLGLVALAENNNDLALDFFLRSVNLGSESGNIIQYRSALEEVIKLYQEAEDHVSAFNYSQRLVTLTKPYMELHAQLDNLNKQYKAERAQHLIAEYEMQKNVYRMKLRRNIIVAILSTLFIMGVVFYLWYRKRSRHQIAGLSLHNDMMLYQINPDLFREVQEDRNAS